ncbi:hypothetical protein SOVF_025790 [Spinacia oleracea]|nr:hypothetical protein SOVF_025790 [Spinacia oleracea]
MQGGSTGIGYGLKYQARCIVDVKADIDHTSFIVGTSYHKNICMPASSCTFFGK